MRSELPLLTKSDYIAGLECYKRLYLKKFHRELAEPPTEADRARMSEGQEVGVCARLLFPGGILIEGDAIAVTSMLLDSAHTLFEAQFVSGGRTAKVDILQRSGDGWRLIEVKSSKMPKEGDKVKDQHLHDVAFQVLVLREAGVNVTSAELMLLSREYVAPLTGVEFSSLFGFADITEEVNAILLDTQFKSIGMLQVLSQSEPPNIEPNTYCRDCGFQEQCGVGQRVDDLLYLPGIKAKLYTQIRDAGVERIGLIPDWLKLSPTQMRVRNVLRDDKPYVDVRLVSLLSEIRFPVYFIDFEAAKWAIPVLPGTESHQPLPFQWSCHVLNREGDDPLHLEFLYRNSDDPRPHFAKTLWENVQSAGSIFVYSSYEMNTLRALNRGGISHSSALCDLLTERGIDLLKIVQENIYLSEFKGSFSIKRVLPAMVPGLGYDDLTIRDGETAAAEYKRMVAATTPLDVCEDIAANLLAYCRRDTLAMVELFKALCRMSGRGSFRCGAGDDEDKPMPDDTKHEQLVLNI